MNKNFITLIDQEIQRNQLTVVPKAYLLEKFGPMLEGVAIAKTETLNQQIPPADQIKAIAAQITHPALKNRLIAILDLDESKQIEFLSSSTLNVDNYVPLAEGDCVWETIIKVVVQVVKTLVNEYVCKPGPPGMEPICKEVTRVVLETIEKEVTTRVCVDQD